MLATLLDPRAGCNHNSHASRKLQVHEVRACQYSSCSSPDAMASQVSTCLLGAVHEHAALGVLLEPQRRPPAQRRRLRPQQVEHRLIVDLHAATPHRQLPGPAGWETLAQAVLMQMLCVWYAFRHVHQLPSPVAGQSRIQACVSKHVCFCHTS